MVDKNDLLELILEEEAKVRNRLLTEFIPGEPKAIPFGKQVAYLSDTSHGRLARCGNRASKTFTNCRDLAWKITRTHWYNEKFNLFKCEKGWKNLVGSDEYEYRYLKSSPRDMWIVGPTYEFMNGVMWGMYLSRMIPEWFIVDIHKTNQGNIDKVYFRNGDILSVRTYSQQDTTKMGFAVNDVYLDEMPPDPKMISELVMRTLDRDGYISMGFTSVEVNEAVREYIDKSCAAGTLSLHNWSLLDNPHYSQNPDRLKRALAEFANLTAEERDARLRGEWYKERPAKPVFEGLELELVDDFPIPAAWRQVRFADPASYVTGFSIYAENPDTGEWFCHIGVELTWAEAVKAEDLINSIERYKPFPSYVYFESVYDNAEAWFGAYARKYGFRPCILKNRHDAIQKTRDAVATKKVKVFKKGAALLNDQFRAYHFTDDGKSVVKKKDHVLDTFMYFCREIPEFIAQHEDNLKTEKQLIYEAHRRELEQGKKIKLAAAPGIRLSPNRDFITQRLRNRGVR